MPPMGINYNGEGEFNHSRCLYPSSLDPDAMLPVSSYMDAHYPPHNKRACLCTPDGLQDYESQKKSSIEILPNECLFEILRRLADPERSACASVSKRWLALLTIISNKADLFHDNILDEEMDLENDGHLTRELSGEEATDTRLAAMAVSTATRGGLGMLFICGSELTRVTNSGLMAIANGCPSLKVLSLWNISSIGDEGLSEIANGCCKLKEIELRRMPSLSDKGLISIAERCPDLSILSIDYCPHIGNAALQTIARHCAKLESISIKECRLVGDLGVTSLLSPTSSVLTKVKLQGLRITDNCLADIGCHGKSVKNLTLVGFAGVSMRGFYSMAEGQGLQSMTSLTISACRGFTDQTLRAIGNGCPSLKQLCLRRCCYLSDFGLVALSKSTTSLESLQLELCDGITLAGVMFAVSKFPPRLRSLHLVRCIGVRDAPISYHMLPPCRTLQSVSIKDCTGFGRVGLIMLGELCPRLRHLELAGLCGMTDDGLLSFLTGREVKLVTLSLRGCINLSDKAIAAIAWRHGAALKVLNLDCCKKITDVSLLAIASRCSSLEDLDLSNTQVSDSGIAALACQKELKLKVLSLSGCRRITNKCIPFLTKLGESLEGLNLQGCPSLSSRRIRSLMPVLWRCHILG